MMYATMTISGSDRWHDGKRLHLLAALLRKGPLRKIGAPMLCCTTANTQPAPRSSRRGPIRQAARGDGNFRFRHFFFGSANYEAAAQPRLPRTVFRHLQPSTR